MRVITLAACLILALGALVSCGDDGRSDAGRAGGSGGSAGSRAGSGPGGAGGHDDAGGEGTDTLAPCLDRPDELPRPPAGRLPCELFPPGFSLETGT